MQPSKSNTNLPDKKQQQQQLVQISNFDGSLSFNAAYNLDDHQHEWMNGILSTLLKDKNYTKIAKNCQKFLSIAIKCVLQLIRTATTKATHIVARNQVHLTVKQKWAATRKKEE